MGIAELLRLVGAVRRLTSTDGSTAPTGRDVFVIGSASDGLFADGDC
jgi:hypothetical protein